MNNFAFYPQLTNELINLSGMEVPDYSFSYKDNNVEYQLEVNYENGEYIIVDKRNVWNVKDYNLILKTRIKISNPYVLFGKDGIAPSKSTIKIALQWMSKASNKRNTKNIASFSIQDNYFEETKKINIPPDTLKDSVKLRMVLIIGNVEEIGQNEKILANKKGLIIGSFKEAKIMLEGKGSEFPITRCAYGKSGPLWKLVYSPNDPSIDKFMSENICLILNTDHRDYKLIDEENLNQSSALFKEIFSTAIVMILCNLEKEGFLEIVKSGANFEEESICAAMYYFLRTFNINTSDLTSMMVTVKESVGSLL